MNYDFTELEIQQIRDVLDLSVEQLLPNSDLRICLRTTEQNDTRYNLNVVGTVRQYLVEISSLDDKIKAVEDDPSNSFASVNITGEYSYTKDYRTDMAEGYRVQRARLVNKLARDLQIYRKVNAGRLLRS